MAQDRNEGVLVGTVADKFEGRGKESGKPFYRLTVGLGQPFFENFSFMVDEDDFFAVEEGDPIQMNYRLRKNTRGKYDAIEPEITGVKTATSQSGTVRAAA